MSVYLYNTSVQSYMTVILGNMISMHTDMRWRFADHIHLSLCTPPIRAVLQGNGGSEALVFLGEECEQASLPRTLLMDMRTSTQPAAGDGTPHSGFRSSTFAAGDGDDSASKRLTHPE